MKTVKLRKIGYVALGLCVIGLFAVSGHLKIFFSQYQVSNTQTNHSRDIQVQRKSLLRQQCQSHNLGNMSDVFDLTTLSRKVKLLYSDKHKFILCEIPKCASSSMKKLLLTIENLVNITDATKVRSNLAHQKADAMLDLRHVRNAENISNRIRSYTKLLIVRNPLYRLLSAYRNKLEKEYPCSKSFADISRQIHSKFSTNDTGGQLATFSEFLRFAATDSDRERHWELYNNLCLPCTIRYDVIAHVETIREDMEAFMDIVSMDRVTFPSNYDATKLTDEDKVMRYMQAIPTNIINKVFNGYKIDFELFGFKIS